MLLHSKKSLSSDNKMRRLGLESIVLVHDFCSKLVGSNQIKTEFGPEYE